ncbi:LamG domain-containing protein [Winogradskyella sp.]|uniref:LamG domain-containing protein n=1 Tax=Winogradskyella sp. TaxID=1883156 RepID=UPI0025D5D613|nr:LamG domain-containing protein [Winogradskyella sp.]
MKNIISLLILTLIFSCGEKKETKQEKPTEKVTVTEKKIDIKGQKYSMLFSGIRNENENDDVSGKYVKNRFGVEKSAVYLDGMADYVKTFNLDSINAKKELTISVWYKPISFKGSGNDPVVLKPSDSEDSALPQYYIGATGNEHPSDKVRGSFRFGLVIDGKFNSIRTKPDTWIPDNWYNIIGTYDGKSMKLYVNGEVLNNRTIEGKLLNNSSDLLLGMHNSMKYGAPGVYDDFRFYKRGLTKSEVEEIAANKS